MAAMRSLSEVSFDVVTLTLTLFGFDAPAAGGDGGTAAGGYGGGGRGGGGGCGGGVGGDDRRRVSSEWPVAGEGAVAVAGLLDGWLHTPLARSAAAGGG